MDSVQVRQITTLIIIGLAVAACIAFYMYRQRIEGIEGIESKAYKNGALFTTYFTSKPDPQRKEHAPTDDIIYIKPWYESVCKLGLNGYVFHDGLSEEFVTQHTNENVKFIEVAPETIRYSLNDHRFVVYLEFLRENPEIDAVFMTDGNDVTVKQNPFDALNPDAVYVGSEQETIDSNKWLNRRFQFLNQGGQNYVVKPSRWRKNPLYSAGILGGSREMSIQFLISMVNIFDSLNEEQREKNVNMAAFNYTVYQEFRKRLITGAPLHSNYKSYENDRQDVWFIHK